MRINSNYEFQVTSQQKNRLVPLNADHKAFASGNKGGIRTYGKFIGFILALFGKSVRLEDSMHRVYYVNKNSLKKWLQEQSGAQAAHIDIKKHGVDTVLNQIAQKAAKKPEPDSKPEPQQQMTGKAPASTEASAKPLSAEVQPAKKQDEVKKEKIEPQKKEFSKEKCRFYDFDRAPPVFTETALNRSEEFNQAYLAVQKTLESQTKSFDVLLQEERNSNSAGRSEGGLISLVKEKIQPKVESALLEKVTTEFIDILWPDSKWSNNQPRKDVKEFLAVEVKKFRSYLSSTEGNNPTETRAFYRFLSTVQNEIQNQLK